MASFHFIRLRLCAMRVEVFSLHRLLTSTSILVEDDDVVVVAFEALFGTTMSHGASRWRPLEAAAPATKAAAANARQRSARSLPF